MPLLNLTREEALVKVKTFKPAKRKVEYLSKFDREVFRKGKIKNHNTTIDRVRYLEDERPLYRTDRITKEQVLKSEEIITYIDSKTKELFVLEKSGGVSLFDMVKAPEVMKLGKNECWYGLVVPKEKKLPTDLIIAKDVNPGRDGSTHYSIQPKCDMSLKDFVKKLQELAEYMKII